MQRSQTQNALLYRGKILGAAGHDAEFLQKPMCNMETVTDAVVQNHYFPIHGSRNNTGSGNRENSSVANFTSTFGD
ncbi:MAG: hypothetical protein DWH80_07540 [Planctomycetota bacterium]|nr:MAG: hypothetical protein DWH80_07540 [Planctomycetota bacterium]